MSVARGLAGNGQCEAVLFALEEETKPQRFSIHRLIHYCVDLAELCETDRIVPVVIFLRPGTCPQQLQLGTHKRTYLDFSYISCHLASLRYTDYCNSDNIVARLNLFNMACVRTPRLQVYDQSLHGLFTLESDPKRREKYVDFIDIYANLSEQEYLTEEHHMTSFKQSFRDQGIQQGAADILLGQLAVKFGQTPNQAMRTRVTEADPDTLRDWSARILSARSVQEVFASDTHLAEG